MLVKTKRVRLRGKAKHELRQAIFERDGYRCVICGNVGEEWHHSPYGINKQDLIECGVALCSSCHRELHSGKNSLPYNRIVKKYLKKLYGV